MQVDKYLSRISENEIKYSSGYANFFGFRLRQTGQEVLYYCEYWRHTNILENVEVHNHQISSNLTVFNLNVEVHNHQISSNLTVFNLNVEVHNHQISSNLTVFNLNGRLLPFFTLNHLLPSLTKSHIFLLATPSWIHSHRRLQNSSRWPSRPTF